jgi:hypothetical protein
MLPKRPLWITIPLIMLLFLGGAVLGMELAERLAPDSWVAAFVGLFMLPLAFMLGMQFWLGLALLGAIGYGLRYLVQRAAGSTASLRESVPTMIPPGSVAFFPIASLSGALGGLITGLVASEAGFFAVLSTYTAVGVGYGLICWQLARNGWLPFPEEA